MQKIELQNALRAKPFKPIHLYVTDGSTIDITHPDLCFLLRRTAIIGHPLQPGEEDEGDRFSIVDLTLISRLDTRGTPNLTETKGEE